MFRRHVLARYRLYSRRTKRYVLHKILHADDPPHKLALGIALGMFVTFTPTVGFQMVLVFCIAWLLRANKAVGVPLVWLSNPVTIPPIFWFNYAVGAVVMRSDLKGIDWFEEVRTHAEAAAAGADWWLAGWWARASVYGSELMEIFVELWVGSLIVACVLGVLTYFPCYYGICWYRMKRWGQLVPPSAQQEKVDESEPPAEEQDSPDRSEALSGSVPAGGDDHTD